MVTTFHPAVDFDESAKLLDKQRLLKQWVESRQIWMVLRDVHDIQALLGFRKCPTKREDPVQLFQERMEWYRELQAAYKATGLMFGFRDGEYWEIPRKEAKKNPEGYWFCNVSASAKWEKTGEGVDVLVQETVQGKKRSVWYPFLREHVFLASEGERLFTLGFGNHTSTLAWLGHEDALAAYTNAHLRYWKSKGGNTEIQELPHGDYETPWWLNNRLVCNHRAILHWKNPKAYAEWEPFRTTQDKEEYLWPSQLGEEDRYWLAEGMEDSLNPEEWG